MSDQPSQNITYLPSRTETAKAPRPKKLGKRHRDALIVANGVLVAICSRKVFTEHRAPWCIGYDGGGFTIIHSDPVFAGHYGLEIWPKGARKVFNIRWDSTGFELPAFKRGSWEQELLAHIAAASGVSLEDVDPRLKTAKVIPFG